MMTLGMRLEGFILHPDYRTALRELISLTWSPQNVGEGSEESPRAGGWETRLPKQIA